MNHFQSFRLYQESAPSMFNNNNSGSFAHNGFSVANSMTGNFFIQVFRKLTYFKRRGSLGTLANRLDGVLEREYLKYLHAGKPGAAQVVAAVESGEYEDEDAVSNTDTLSGSAGAPGTALVHIEPVPRPQGEPAQQTVDIDHEVVGEEQAVTEEDLPKRHPVRLPAAPMVKLLKQSNGKPYSNPVLDNIEDAIANVESVDAAKKLYHRLVAFESHLGQQVEMIQARMQQKQSHEDAVRMSNYITDNNRAVLLFAKLLCVFKKGVSDDAKSKCGVLDATDTGTEDATPLVPVTEQALLEDLNVVDGAVRDPQWTKENKAALMAAVNMDEIEGFHIRAKLYMTDGNRKRDQLRLENLWEQVLNDVYKKWFYIYDTAALKAKLAPAAAAKPVAGEAAAAKAAYRANAAFDSVFERETSTYLSPAFVGITAVKAQYFIFTLNANKMLLLKKCTFHKNMLFFKIVGELTFLDGKDHEFYICEDWKRNKEIAKEETKITLLNPDNKYPLVLFFRDKVYSTDIADNATEVPSIRLDQFTLTAIKKDSIFKSIIENTKKKNTSTFDGTLDTNLGTDVVAKFEKLIRK